MKKPMIFGAWTYSTRFCWIFPSNWVIFFTWSSFHLFHQNSWKSMLKIGRFVFFLPLRHPIFVFTTGKHHKAKAIREQTRHGLMEQKWLSREQGVGSWSCTVQAMFKLILVWFPDRCACSWTGNGKQIKAFFMCNFCKCFIWVYGGGNFVPETLHFFSQTVYCLGFSMLS